MFADGRDGGASIKQAKESQLQLVDILYHVQKCVKRKKVSSETYGCEREEVIGFEETEAQIKENLRWNPTEDEMDKQAEKK
eukprot:766679-Hanusia_phi.AAC.5